MRAGAVDVVDGVDILPYGLHLEEEDVAALRDHGTPLTGNAGRIRLCARAPAVNRLEASRVVPRKEWDRRRALRIIYVLLI